MPHGIKFTFTVHFNATLVLPDRLLSSCVHGPPTSPLKWYSGGAPMIQLPLLVVDNGRPWGGDAFHANVPAPDTTK